MAKEIANIDEELAAKAQAMQKTLLSTAKSARIGTQGKRFTLPNGKVLGDSFKGVILGMAKCNTYYEGAFNAKNPQQPVCSALALFDDAEDMAPGPNIEKPCSTDCKTCEKNEWGSRGDGSNAKACKNTYRVAVLLPSEGDEIFDLYISPTALSNWSKAIAAINAQYGFYIKALSTIAFDPSSSFSVIGIKTAEPNPDYREHAALIDDVEKQLLM